MASSTSVLIPRAVYNDLVHWANAAYPHEGCGLLVGRFGNQGQKEVVRFAKLTNDLLRVAITDAPTLPSSRQGQGAGKTEFVMNPDEFNRVTLQAEKEGLDVVGVIHTHPDHPPRPSQIDSSQPFLAQWSNIIVSVENGSTKDMKSWFRDNDTDPFVEEILKIV